uniref:Uncharacterized protein n=1 Tax=Glossina austeni TaxID=7395 RepID=A0A1A9VXP4_GLOAU
MDIIGEKDERNIGKLPDGILDEFLRCNNEIGQDMLDDISQPPNTSHAGEMHIKTEIVNNKCFDNRSERNQTPRFETTSYSSLYNVSVRIVEEIDKWIKKDEKENESTSLTVNENQIIEKKDLDLPPSLQPLTAKNSEMVLANNVSFSKDVATQTDDNDTFDMIREIDSCDVAAETMQENRLSEPRLGFVTRNFNSNQMTAMLDFAELLTESRSLDYLDVYNVRQRMLAIYKSSLSPEINRTNAFSHSRDNLTNEFSNRGPLTLTPVNFAYSHARQCYSAHGSRFKYNRISSTKNFYSRECKKC